MLQLEACAGIKSFKPKEDNPDNDGTGSGENVHGEKRSNKTHESTTDPEARFFNVSPSGYGIRWPLIDEDLSIDGLLDIKHSPNLNRKSA